MWRKLFSWLALPRTNIASEHRPKPKRTGSSSKHQFSGGKLAVSFRKGISPNSSGKNLPSSTRLSEVDDGSINGDSCFCWNSSDLFAAPHLDGTLEFVSQFNEIHECLGSPPFNAPFWIWTEDDSLDLEDIDLCWEYGFLHIRQNHGSKCWAMVSAESKQLEKNLSRWSSILIIWDIFIWAGDQLETTSLGWGWIPKVTSTKNEGYFFSTSKNPYIKISKVLKGSQAMYKSQLVFIRLMSFVYWLLVSLSVRILSPCSFFILMVPTPIRANYFNS